jgi:hypothetical protein
MFAVWIIPSHVEMKVILPNLTMIISKLDVEVPHAKIMFLL